MAPESLGLLIGNLALLAFMVTIGARLLYLGLQRVPPSMYAEMERTMADMNREFDKFRSQQAADHREIRALRSEVIRIDAELQRWMASYAAVVREFVVRVGEPPKEQPPFSLAATAPPEMKASALADLRRNLVDSFTVSEIEGIAFEMDLSGELEGGSLSERALSLVNAAKHRDMLPRLVELCRRDRPDSGF